MDYVDGGLLVTGKPRLANAVTYAYRKRDNSFGIAVNPPMYPLPGDAEFWARERTDVLEWVKQKEQE